MARVWITTAEKNVKVQSKETKLIDVLYLIGSVKALLKPAKSGVFKFMNFSLVQFSEGFLRVPTYRE